NVGKLAGFGLTLPAAELALAKPLPLLAGERIGSGVLLTDNATRAVEGAMAAPAAECLAHVLDRRRQLRPGIEIAAVMGRCRGGAGRAIDAVLALASLSTSLGTTAWRGSGAHNICVGHGSCARLLVADSPEFGQGRRPGVGIGAQD